jgi:outer membrane protein
LSLPIPIRWALAVATLTAVLLCLGPAAGYAQQDQEGQRARLTALDRAVSARPNDPQLRVDLGLALLEAGLRDRALYHLEQARAAPLTPQSRAQLDDLLARIGRQKDREGWFNLALVPETNPVQRTDLDTVWIGGLPFQLNPNAQAQRATGLHVGLGGAIMPRLSDSVRLRLGASVSARLFENRALEDIILRGEIGFQGQTLGGQDWQITGSVAQRSIGGQNYAQGLGLHGRWSQYLGRSTLVRLSAEAVRWRFVGQPALDGPRLQAAVELRHALRPDLLVTGGLSFVRVDARAAHEAGKTMRLNIGAQRSFAGGWVVGVDAFVQRHRRDGPDPVFGIQRKDKMAGLGLRAHHRDFTFGNFTPVFEVSTTRQSSNNVLQEWRNTRLSIGLTRTF